MSQSALLAIDATVARSIPVLDHAPTPQQIAAFRRAGVGIARGLLTSPEVNTLRDAFMDAASQGPIDGISEQVEFRPDQRDDPLRQYPRMLHPHRHLDREIGRLSLKHMLDPRCDQLLRAVTGEEYIAAQSMFYFKPPGARGQGLHQDNQPLSVSPGTCLAIWIALDRCDAENGALSVIPGTGPLDMLCEADYEDRVDVFFNGGSMKLPEGVEPVTAVMDPGDALVFNGQVVHGSFRNTTHDRWRRTLIFHYAPKQCDQVAAFYHPLLDFDGQVVEKQVSPDGGPCGQFRDQDQAESM